jgi:hypothetical protein
MAERSSDVSLNDALGHIESCIPTLQQVCDESVPDAGGLGYEPVYCLNRLTGVILHLEEALMLLSTLP